MIESVFSGFAPKKRTNERRAQELFYDALDASSSQQFKRLLRQALELDPENVDALLLLEEFSECTPDERIETLSTIVAIAAERLGEQAFQELIPHFWGFLETRPYMRARQRLALALREAGRLNDAMLEYTQMLDLNENDNQGIRYELLPLLLAQERLEDARALLDRYRDDQKWNVVFAWGRVLERLLSGDELAASAALTAARKQNPHIEAFLKGRRKLPRSMPDSYTPGSKEEAQCYAGILTLAWKAHPEAAVWLAKQSTRSRKPRE